MKIRYQVTIYGLVQGIGFRPFIHKLVKKYHISGWVCNSNQGVEMEIEGGEDDCRKFFTELKKNPPPLAVITRIKAKKLSLIGYTKFVIKKSQDTNTYPIILMPPDISICEDCLEELTNPSDRRYHYPFINCTNCGPRFTIIKDMPYDREKTTMRDFIMCPDCDKEYHNLENRRYHAQPNACPICGPQVSLYVGNRKIETIHPIKEAQKRLKEGQIGAIKGLGGFHLTGDAQNNNAVSKIRAIKRRDQKPFALMAENVLVVKKYCFLTKLAQKYLESKEKPIVLLKKKNSFLLSPDIAPGNAYLGFMLPYTPLHFLLLQGTGMVLVMTSANFSDEPIIIENEEAFQKLAYQVDFLLVHNRQIYNRCDDSVLKVTGNNSIFIRRSRGYAPFPIILPEKTKSVLALGPEEKNTVCLTRDQYAFPSQHLGDLKNSDTFQAYQEAVQRLIRVFQFKPEVIACDLHPDYLSTYYAKQLTQQFKVPLLKIQHHHAHIVSCMAEHNITDRVIGVAFDGTGFGPDNTIWGGEFLIVSLKDYIRVGHLKYLAMPGGEQAIIEPWRMAFSYLYSFSVREIDSIPLVLRVKRPKWEFSLLQQMIDKRINSPLTSSCGRLFDAVAALIGLKDKVDFEGQAAMELEGLCKVKYKEKYHYHIRKEGNHLVVNSKIMFHQIISDLKRKTPLAQIATQFHNTVADFILSLCVKIREDYNINSVALSGGVFQNSYLLAQTVHKLKKENFRVLIHKKLPPNDACVALGQAIVANAQADSIHYDV